MERKTYRSNILKSGCVTVEGNTEDERINKVILIENEAGLCQGCYEHPCVCLPDDYNIDPD